METNHTPPQTLRTEIRFAVVMYGGVSLAIYINGVAQELVRLVRATALKIDEKTGETPLFSNEELSGAGQVYRQLGQILGSEWEGNKAKEWDPEHPPDVPIRTRFVIDILSGTSAGGINAIFLAKALANGQDMTQLQELWVEEGDIEKLINDKGAVKDLAGKGLKQQKPPQSLLSGQRMYYKLVEAFDGMEGERMGPDGTKCQDYSKSDTPSPYVEELSLFVTATDLDGLPVPLRLADDVVFERRHRNVFQFQYKKEVKNDFHAGNNALLAFAARCTSSFPFAFEPMRLVDIDATLRATGRPWHRNSGKEWEQWLDFFPAYRRVNGIGGDHFTQRAFADGGYLDNKPFGYAIDALATRSAEYPVDRKLIYIEPNPEYISPYTNPDAPPNAIENTLLAVSKLPRYETIREDLQGILTRNRQIERVETLITGMEEDVAAGSDARKYILGSEYEKLYLDEMIQQRKIGISYGGYHRLKVATVTNEIARMITRAAGFDEQSDEFLAIRHLVRAWRDNHFARYKKDSMKDCKLRASENMFLLQYDLSYRLRRLNFVLLKIDQLGSPDAKNREETLKHKKHILQEHLGDEKLTQNELDELKRLREELLSHHSELRRKYEALHSLGDSNPLHEQVAEVVKKADIDANQVREILKAETAEGEYKKAQDAFDSFACKLGELIKETTVKTSQACEALLNRAHLAVALIRDYYDTYELYDLIMFPTMHMAEIGQEIDPVEVLRISPKDARSIIDERTSPHRKLAGTALGNFGAFLDANWRKNDILWGRLDGAERIISALIKDECLRKKLVYKAHCEILAEHFDLAGHRMGQAMENKTPLQEGSTTSAPSPPQAIDPAKKVKAKKKSDSQQQLEKVRASVKKAGDALRRANHQMSTNPEIQGVVKRAKAAVDEAEAALREGGATQENRRRNLKEKLQTIWDPVRGNRVKSGTARNKGSKSLMMTNPFIQEAIELIKMQVKSPDPILYKKVLYEAFKEKYVGQIDRQPNREMAVRSMARSTRVIGHLFEGIADAHHISRRSGATLAKLGAIFSGLVEVAVPDSVLSLLRRRWFILFYLSGALLIIGGSLLEWKQTRNLGGMVLGVTAALHLGILLLGDYMRDRKTAWRVVKLMLGIVVSVLILIGMIELRRFMPDPTRELSDFWSWITRKVR